MKQILTCIFLLIFGIQIAFTQTSPLDPVCTFNYQAVVRDADDNILPDRAIIVQLTVMDGPDGNALHIEQHSATTTTLGLVNLEVGAGMRVGGIMAFEAIPWVIRRHYLKVEVDPDGGNDFIDLGASPILAVPIAVQAKWADVAIATMDTVKLFDTLRVRTICVDTIKAKVACLDTIKAQAGCIDSIKGDVACLRNIKSDIGTIDSILTKKVFTADLCVDDGDGIAHSVIFPDPQTGLVTAEIRKIKTRDLCFIDEEGVSVGNIYGDFGTAIANIDKLEGFVSVDTLDVDVLCVDSLKTNTFCSFETFQVKNILGEPVFTIEPNAGLDYAFNILGNVMIAGGLSAEFKSFVIDHPLDPENKTLRHFSIESDRLTNIYNGTVKLDQNGRAEVQLPEWFEALNTEFSYQLTCIGGFANIYIAREVQDNYFTIAGGHPDMKVSWQVTGVRHDRQAKENRMPIEAWK